MLSSEIKLVSEYRFVEKETGTEVKARVIQLLERDNPGPTFEWEISHYYKPDENSAEPYKPSGMHGGTAKDAEFSLLRYARGFTKFITENTSYTSSF